MIECKRSGKIISLIDIKRWWREGVAGEVGVEEGSGLAFAGGNGMRRGVESDLAG